MLKLLLLLLPLACSMEPTIDPGIALRNAMNELHERMALQDALMESALEDYFNEMKEQSCPAIGDLPIVTPDRKEFYGMRYYFEKGHAVPSLSCNGAYDDVVSGLRYSSDTRQAGIPMGTLFVHAGCTFYGFSDINYNGHYKEYKGPVFLYEVPNVFGHICRDDGTLMNTMCTPMDAMFTRCQGRQDAVNNGTPCVLSYLVRCDQTMPDCVPHDKWSTVASHDNTGSSLAITFTYTKTIGTTWSDEMSEANDTSHTVSAEMKASFWGFFEVGMGISDTTGYNWGHVSTEAKEESQTVSVSTVVPGGKHIKIEQATGYCGSSQVSTEVFKSVEIKDKFTTEMFRSIEIKDKFTPEMFTSVEVKDSFNRSLFTLPLAYLNEAKRQSCPAIGDLPIVTPDRKEFYGMRYYFKKGHAVPSLSCNGLGIDTVSGYRYSTPDGGGIPMGTLFVHAGCTFYGFSENNYNGDYKEYTGPVFLYEVPDVFGHKCRYDGSLVPCVLSYLVRCAQTMPDCVPQDGWSTVASYDNAGSSLTSTFTYTKTIGTTWSDEMSEANDVSYTVSAEMKATFWGVFEVGMGISATTGYNWGHVSTQAKEESQEHTVSTDVPGGKNIKIEQATGHCGSSQVSTEMFRSIEIKDKFTTEMFTSVKVKDSFTRSSATASYFDFKLNVLLLLLLI